MLMTRTRRRPMLFSDEGETYARVDWVWPEQARHYPKSN